MPSNEFGYKSNLTHNKAIRVSVPEGWEIVSKIPMIVEHGMRYIARREGSNFGGLAAEQRPAYSILEGRRFIIRPTIGGVDAERVANGEPTISMSLVSEILRARSVPFEPSDVAIDAIRHIGLRRSLAGSSVAVPAEAMRDVPPVVCGGYIYVPSATSLSEEPQA